MTDRDKESQKAIPPEPEKPLRDDCCGGGACCPCIWDVYYDKLDKWKEAKREYEAQHQESDKKKIT